MSSPASDWPSAPTLRGSMGIFSHVHVIRYPSEALSSPLLASGIYFKEKR